MLSKPDAIVLCGGAGLRLKSITGKAPKAMTPVAGRPFLELLLRQLGRHEFRRVILAVGYQKEAIRSHFGEHALGLNLTYSAESSPLGTGGALRNAADLLESSTALIMNGDSYTDADLRRFVSDHGQAKSDISLVVVPADGRCDCGLVDVDKNRKVIRFEERAGSRGAEYANAGIYLVSRDVLYGIPTGTQISLEEDLFPQWLGEGRHIQACICPGPCVDIGTPERYHTAQRLLANIEVEARLPR